MTATLTLAEASRLRTLAAIWGETATREAVEQWWENHEDRWPECSRTHLYVIQAGKSGPVKIGISFDSERRLANIQASHYKELRLVVSDVPACKHLERVLHDFLISERLRGEWFTFRSPRVRDLVKRLKERVAL